MPKGGLALTLALLLLVPVASAQPASDTQGSFTLEWQGGARRDRPIVWGYISNGFPLPAADVELRVEGLDTAGNVVSTTKGYVNRPVDTARQYFEVAVPGQAARYRVTVSYFQWVRPGM